MNLSMLGKLASKAVQFGSTASRHLNTADKLLTVAQSHADKYLSGTDLHKRLSNNIALAKGHVGTVQALNTKLTSTIKNGGSKKKKRSKRKSNKKSKRKPKRKTTSRKSRHRH